MAAVETLLFAMVAVPAGVWATAWALRYMREMEALKKKWGLEWQGGKLVGEHQGCRYAITPPDDSRQLSITLEHGLDLRDLQLYNETFVTRTRQLMMGRDIQLGSPELDETFYVASRDEAFARMLLTHPTVLAMLERFRQDKWSVWLTGDQLTLTGPGSLTSAGHDYISSTLSLAEALSIARRTPWAEVAEAFGLELDEAFRRMRGRVREHQVRVEHAGTGGDSFTQVRVRLSPTRPGLLLTGAAEAPTLPIGDPILDGRVRGKASSSFCSALRDDEVRGPLLAVLLEHEGMVDAQSVTLQCTGRASPRQLQTLLRDGVDLAEALSHIP